MENIQKMIETEVQNKMKELNVYPIEETRREDMNTIEEATNNVVFLSDRGDEEEFKTA
jgi:hypothetical protein